MIARIKESIPKYLSAEMYKLLSLALPVLGSSILHMAYNFTDMIWVGKLGSNAVASVGTAGFFIHLGWAFASIIGVGVGVKISHSIGAKNKNEAGKFATTGAWGIAIISMIWVSFLLIFASSLIGFFKLQTQEVIDGAEIYLRISALGSLLFFSIVLLNGIFNAHGFTKLSFRASLVGTLINIVLDPIFIFVLDLGIMGAALASIIAQAFSFSFYIYLIFSKKRIKFYGFLPKLDKLWMIIKIGTPVSLQRICFTLFYIIIARFIAEWGPVAIAVQKIGVQIEAITYMMVYGILQATSIMVGQSYGANDYQQIPKIYKAGLKLSLIIGVLSSSLFFLFPGALFSIFINEPESIKIGREYLIILGFSQLFMCVEMISTGVFHGLGKTKFPAIVSISITSLRIPGAYLLGFYSFLELNGIWWSISGTSILKGIVLFIILTKILSQYKTKTVITKPLYSNE